jgi:hypothetical protein
MITLYNVLDKFKEGYMYADTPVYDKKGKYRKLSYSIMVELSNGQVMSISRGFTWDENSIPWILQPLFPKSGLYAPSALIHDALYYLTVHERDWVEKEYIKWMAATGVSPKQMAFRYWAVKTFGGRWWNRNKNNPRKLCIANRRYLTLSTKKSVDEIHY